MNDTDHTQTIIDVAYELGCQLRDDSRVNQGSVADPINVAVCLLSTLMAADIITAIHPDKKDLYIDTTLKFVKAHIELDLKRFRENVL